MNDYENEKRRGVFYGYLHASLEYCLLIYKNSPYKRKKLLAIHTDTLENFIKDFYNVEEGKKLAHTFITNAIFQIANINICDDDWFPFSLLYKGDMLTYLDACDDDDVYSLTEASIVENKNATIAANYEKMKQKNNIFFY